METKKPALEIAIAIAKKKKMAMGGMVPDEGKEDSLTSAPNSLVSAIMQKRGMKSDDFLSADMPTNELEHLTYPDDEEDPKASRKDLISSIMKRMVK